MRRATNGEKLQQLQKGRSEKFKANIDKKWNLLTI